MKSRIHKIGIIGVGLSVAFYALCMLWGMLITDPLLATLHYNLLQIAFPGFDFSVGGITIGLVESVVYGYTFGILFGWLCKITCVKDTN